MESKLTFLKKIGEFSNGDFEVANQLPAGTLIVVDFANEVSRDPAGRSSIWTTHRLTVEC